MKITLFFVYPFSTTGDGIFCKIKHIQLLLNNDS